MTIEATRKSVYRDLYSEGETDSLPVFCVRIQAIIGRFGRRLS